MAVKTDLAKLGKRAADHKAGRDRYDGPGNFIVEADSSRFIILCPPHENMGGYPFVENMYHHRDIPRDANGSFNIRCMRNNYKDDTNKCAPCTKMVKFRKKRKDKGDKWDEKAREHAPKLKPIGQVIDITCIMRANGEIKKKVKPCFGAYGDEDGCDKCYMRDACEDLPKKYYCPVGVWEELLDHFEDEGDITDLSKAIPIRIKRKGSGRYDTKYKTKAFPKSAIEFPSKARKRIEKALYDLSTLDPKPEGTADEIKEKYRKFFSLEDIDTDTSGDDDDDEPKRRPRSGGKKKSAKKNNKKKSSENTDKKKRGEKLRNKLKKKAKKGKLDR